MKHVDILNLQFEPYGRDPEATFPLVWYLEHVYKHSIRYGSMMDARYLIDTLKPKALLLNNIAGNEFNVTAATYAHAHGVQVISLTSEGLYFEYQKSPKELFWGNIKQKRICWHTIFFWSDYFLDKMRKYFPSFRETFDISGSTGIDRLVMYSFMRKRTFLKKYKKEKYQKVILYVGYMFSLFFNKQNYKKQGVSPILASTFRADYIKTKKLLYKMIAVNSDILFILKKHPGETNLHMEIDYDLQSANILILEDQESLADLINISDLLFVYDSTVSYESYMLGKPVINIAPNDSISYKNDSIKGNVRVRNPEQAQKYMEEYYKTGRIKDFDEKGRIRRDLLRQDVGFVDGLNSWRTANKIHTLLKHAANNTVRYFSLIGYAVHGFLQINRLLFFIPRIEHSIILKYYNEFSLFYDLKKRYDPQIQKHYQRKISPNIEVKKRYV